MAWIVDYLRKLRADALIVAEMILLERKRKAQAEEAAAMLD